MALVERVKPRRYRTEAGGRNVIGVPRGQCAQKKRRASARSLRGPWESVSLGDERARQLPVDDLRCTRVRSRWKGRRVERFCNACRAGRRWDTCVRTMR